jgi:hypothetical protein
MVLTLSITSFCSLHKQKFTSFKEVGEISLRGHADEALSDDFFLK